MLSDKPRVLVVDDEKETRNFCNKELAELRQQNLVSLFFFGLGDRGDERRE